VIRPARPDDVPAVHALVRELATYERALDEVEASEGDLAALLFGPAPGASCHVAEADGQVVGMAFWYLTTSTWTGRQGLWLEDLYVRPAYRGHGHGLALLRALAQLCVDSGYRRLEWWVLDWNSPAIEFYRAVGAQPMQEWTVQRLGGSALRRLAAG
jgi:GNAT superfamily N-acetyltransferase